MVKLKPKLTFAVPVRFQIVRLILPALMIMLVAQIAQVSLGQVQCDPTKVMSAEACAKCHSGAVQVWQSTPHFKTFTELSRNPEAKAICKKMGLRSVKRSNVCIDCHFTQRESNGRAKPVSGVSCESCHGASAEWINVHNDYGGPTANRESESEQHAAERLASSTAAGMRNTRNLYLIASSCLNCHTVPNEKLVNVGGHRAGSKDFELVAWSQGSVRHNFLRTDGSSNAHSSPERLRVMYIVGLIADLEYSTRATAVATQNATYGIEVANRAARSAMKLYTVQQKIENPEVQKVLEVFAQADLRTNNAEQLFAIAHEIQNSGSRFATENDGSKLAAIDPFLPDPSTYK